MNARDCLRSPSTPLEAAVLLVAAVRELAAADSVEQVAAVVREAARSLARADGATFVLREGGNCYYLDESAIAPLWKGRRFPLEACISGWSMTTRQQVVIPDIRCDPRIPQDAYAPTFVRSLLMTPVRTADPWAAIGVYWADEYRPTTMETEWLQALADSTAVAMETIRVRAASELPPKPAAGEREIVTMCAWTRRFRLKDEWLSPDQFCLQRFGVLVTHGISPDALEGIVQSLPDETAGPDR